jgi:hypothetical protein
MISVALLADAGEDDADHVEAVELLESTDCGPQDVSRSPQPTRSLRPISRRHTNQLNPPRAMGHLFC